MPAALRQEFIVCYDVEDNRTRALLYKELCKHGLKPAQKSVFWGFLTAAEATAICRFWRAHLRPTDRAFIIRAGMGASAQNRFFGHSVADFQDWRECDVI